MFRAPSISNLREPTFYGVWRPKLLGAKKDYVGLGHSDYHRQGRKPESECTWSRCNPTVCPAEMADRA